MRKILFILASFFVISAQAGFDESFTGATLRFDYFRTGNYQTEIISVDELIEEGPWAGSRINLTDPFDYGKHKFEVCDAASGKVIYSYHHCSLFNEWQTTDEAKLTWRSFGETILFPYPRKPASVVFYSRDRQNRWNKLFEYVVDPASIFISREKKAIFPVIDVNTPAAVDKGLDIVFLPEGYTAAEMQKFKNDCERFAGYIKNSVAFSGFDGKINIRAVMAPSIDSGTDIPGQNLWKNTSLNSNFYTFGSERYLMTMDVKRVRNLAANAPCDQIVILVNTSKYGGGGIYNYYAVTTSDHSKSDYVFIHEFGHSFAALGDEYYNSEVAYVDYYDLTVEPWEPNLTTLVGFSSKWKDILRPDTPIPTPADTTYHYNTVGVFEGGGYTAKGVYRPFMDCTMKSIIFDAFCPVCRRSITRMLEYYTQ